MAAPLMITQMTTEITLVEIMTYKIVSMIPPLMTMMPPLMTMIIMAIMEMMKLVTIMMMIEVMK